jgi:alcohol dehydrogenase
LEKKVAALVLEGPRKLVRHDVPKPTISDDDALLSVLACGLCGSDHEQWTGTVGAAVPMIPGHETVGVIAEIGDSAARAWGVDVGDRVAVEPFVSCQQCPECLAGRARACRTRGMRCYGQLSTTEAPALWGGYAQMQYLSPGTVLRKVPPNLSDVLASSFNAVGAGYQWGVRAPRTGEGDRVAVLGPGIRGISAALAAKDAGAAFTMVSGFGPRDADRLRAARNCGVDLVVDAAVDDPIDLFFRHAGGLANVVLDATANSASAFMQAIELADVAGRVVIAGLRGAVDLVGFRPDLIVDRELHVEGIRGVDSQDYADALALLASGRFDFEAMPLRTAGFSDLGDLLDTMAGQTDDAPPVRAAFIPS